MAKLQAVAAFKQLLPLLNAPNEKEVGIVQQGHVFDLFLEENQK